MQPTGDPLIDYLRSRPLTKREHEVLAWLTTEEGEEEGLLCAVPGGWWMVSEQVGGKVGFSLLRRIYISKTYADGGGEAYVLYVINEDGRAALAEADAGS